MLGGFLGLSLGLWTREISVEFAAAWSARNDCSWAVCGRSLAVSRNELPQAARSRRSIQGAWKGAVSFQVGRHTSK